MSRLVIIQEFGGSGCREAIEQSQRDFIMPEDTTSLVIFSDRKSASYESATLVAALGSATHLFVEGPCLQTPLGIHALEVADKGNSGIEMVAFGELSKESPPQLQTSSGNLQQ